MNNSATSTSLKIHGVNGDIFSMSSAKGSAATSVVAVSASVSDATSVVLMVTFAVELMVSDDMAVVGVGVMATVVVMVEEGVLVSL